MTAESPSSPHPSSTRSFAALAVAAGLAASLSACSKTEKSAATEPAGAASATASAAAAAPTPAPGPLKVAYVYVGPVGDAGWTFAHDRGRLAAAEAFGDRIHTSFVENVPEGADAERVLHDLVGQGNTLIFGTTFGYMEPMLKVARDAKDVRFEHATGYKTAENLRTYDSRTYEGAYMAGVVAGAMTRTHTLGVVGSIPIPEVIRNIDSFTLGAQSVDPKVITRVVWVNKWFDPPHEGEAAQTLIDEGADVLMQNTDSSAVLQTAEKASRFAFGWDSDMSKLAPKAHLASAVIHWGPYYKKAIQEVIDGKWQTGQAWWGVKEGAIDLVSVSERVPADAKKHLASVREGLRDGSFVIWRGPVVDSSGKEVLKAGDVADDRFLHGINFYVKGVQGKPPSP
ncbi:MAG: BMP family ABC transporter substrate-binding protein [Myxococcales bacterium]|nr:BMP family ABC transporter substrate-binding protein [Myxococcales bacterium]